MKFSTCLGALSGKNAISISPNFVLMMALGTFAETFSAAIRAPAPKNHAPHKTKHTALMMTVRLCIMSSFRSNSACGFIIIPWRSGSGLLQRLPRRRLLRLFFAAPRSPADHLAVDGHLNFEEL